MLKNISGQYLHFDLVSVLSGFSVTGFSGAISGRKLIDGNAMALLSGNIVETSGGTYRANLYAEDTNGDDIGFFFTASGCAPRMFSIRTIGGISGYLYLNSGQNVNVYSGQLSGQKVNILSGNTVTILSGTLFATLVSGTTFLASGQAVYVYSGQLSGHVIDLLSGRSYIASGIFATATATVASGATYLASGHFLFGSGQFYLASGSLSGQQVTLTSGQSYTASGIFTVATASVASGGVYLASGHFLFGSGTYYLASGQQVNVYSGQLSGHAVDLLSGRSYTASGIFAAGSVMSGQVWLASGQATSLNSGQVVSLYSGQLVSLFSGQQVAVVSGTFVNTWSGQTQIASGPFVNATATIASGTTFLASGSQVIAATVLDKSGYTLHSSGLDTVSVEAGMNARQALAAIAAATAGRLSGAGTTTVLIEGANVSGTNRINATVDASGNRTAITLSLPG